MQIKDVCCNNCARESYPAERHYVNGVEVNVLVLRNAYNNRNGAGKTKSPLKAVKRLHSLWRNTIISNSMITDTLTFKRLNL